MNLRGVDEAMKQRLFNSIGSRVAFMYDGVARVGKVDTVGANTLTIKLPRPEMPINSRQRSEATDYKSFKFDGITGLRFY